MSLKSMQSCESTIVNVKIVWKISTYKVLSLSSVEILKIIKSIEPSN